MILSPLISSLAWPSLMADSTIQVPSMLATSLLASAVRTRLSSSACITALLVKRITTQEGIVSKALADQHRHPVAARHDAVVVSGGLADHADALDAGLIGHQQAADARAHQTPAAVLQPHRREIGEGRPPTVAPPAALEGRQPGPAGTG